MDDLVGYKSDNRTKPIQYARLCIVVCAIFLLNAFALADTSILSSRGDNGRTGANLNEIILNTSNINPQSFGKLVSYAVDGFIYAQPVVASNVFAKGRLRNVVYVATMNNVIYAFDADNFGDDGGLLWHVRLGYQGALPVPYSDLVPTAPPSQYFVRGNVGITGTPVIDPVSNTIYFVARSKENGAFVQRLHAIDLSDGRSKPGSPVQISGALVVDGTTYMFSPKLQNQRAGLALSQGKVIIAWASLSDFGDYHGWVMAYDGQTLQQTGIFCATCGKNPTNGNSWFGGGIWQSGRAPVVDENGDVYYFIGNGWSSGDDSDGFISSCTSGSASPPPPGYYGESLIKLDITNGLTPIGAFTPTAWCDLDKGDLDWGGSGPLLIPKTTILVGGGKEGRLYVIDSNKVIGQDFGGSPLLEDFMINNTTAEHHHIMGGPVYWQRSASGGSLLYVPIEGDVTRAYRVANNVVDTTPVAHTPATVDMGGHPGPIATLSAKGDTDGTGILWMTHLIPDAGSFRGQNAYWDTKRGILRAFNAANIETELWNSEMIPQRDSLGYFAKFTPPTVANGKAYVAAFPKPDGIASDPPGYDCSTYPENTASHCYTSHAGTTVGYLVIYGLNPPPNPPIKFYLPPLMQAPLFLLGN